jgi:hypothetical protein
VHLVREKLCKCVCVHVMHVCTERETEKWERGSIPSLGGALPEHLAM